MARSSLRRNGLAGPLGVLCACAALAAGAPVATAQSEPGTPGASQPAEEPVRNTDEWNLPKRSTIAIKGYDPVAYFPEGGSKADKGKDSITHTHKGVTYRFASSEHRELFKANPSRYEPAHGGWCSWAMKDGDKTKPDPKNYIVKDDRLFLFYDGWGGDTRKSWRKRSHDDQARQADAEWKKISGEEKRRAPHPPEADGSAGDAGRP